MLEFLCYLASQTLRGSFYIVFMLTLQRLLRNRLSPRVRAALWAPLLIALLAPEICVVRVPVSQPVETTVVDALEQTRAALVPDAKAAPDFGLRRVDGRDVVYLPPSALESGPLKTVAPPFKTVGRVEQILQEIRSEIQEAPFADAETFADFEETPPFQFSEPVESLESFASESVEPSVPEPTDAILAPTVADVAQAPEPDRLNEESDVSSENVASLDPVQLEETPAQLADAPRRSLVPPSRPVDRRAGWFAFFQVAGIVAVALWTLGLGVAFVYLVRSAFVCRRWVRFSAPVDDADVLALYHRCADSLEIAAPPRLATTTDLSSPALLGWRRPVVLVPSEYVDALSKERLAHILLHELAHFKRGDAATGFLAFVVLATHWFNPLFWFAARSFFATREEACDALALGSPALTRPNSAAEYARTLCEIAGRRPRVEQAFGTIGFSPTFRSLRRRVETLGRFGTWGRRAAIGCLLASLAASAFATVRLLPDVAKTDAPTSDEETSVVRKRARRLFATLPTLPQKPVPPTVAPNDPIAAVDVETLYQDEADRLFFGHSTKERQTFVSDAVAKIRSAKAQGEAEYYAALGDYLIGESAFFWLLAGVDAPFRDDAVAASAKLPALAEGQTPADYPKSVSSTELDAALARAEKSADPNFRYLAELHRALLDQAKRRRPAEYRDGRIESLAEWVRSPFWRAQLTPRPCLGLHRELETGAYFLAEAAAQGNGDAAASLARYIANYSSVDLAPSGFVAEVGRRNGITKDDLKSKTPDERPATVAKCAFLYALAGAEAGSPRAQGLVASYYARGFGVERNVAEALRWGERFYEVDAASGAGIIYIPLTRVLKTVVDPETGRRETVPQTLAELNVYDVRKFRRLAPLAEILLCSANDLRNHGETALSPLSRRLFVENICAIARNGQTGTGYAPEIKNCATLFLLAEAALDSEPTPENLALAEKFLRRANGTESRSFFVQAETPDGRAPRLDPDQQRVTPGFVEANERLAEAFESGAFGVKNDEKANWFRLVANELRQNARNVVTSVIYTSSNPSRPAPTAAVEPAVEPADASRSFVAPRTPEFEATIAPIFAKLEKTLVDAKNGNADALTARFNEYFDDATDLYPNGRSGSPEVARYKVERLTQEIERLEQTDADAATLERLRKSRDSWRRLADASRLADETPVAATNA